MVSNREKLLLPFLKSKLFFSRILMVAIIFWSTCIMYIMNDVNTIILLYKEYNIIIMIWTNNWMNIKGLSEIIKMKSQKNLIIDLLKNAVLG